MNSPVISIITSVRNAAPFIDGLLKNVVSQTCFSQCEWIIIQPKGDGFCLDTDKAIKNYQEQYSNIFYTYLDKDPGVYAVWNRCIVKSSGKFVTNWNCDDRRQPDSLQKQIDFFDQNSDVDLLYNDQYWHSTPNWIPWDSRYSGVDPYPIHHTLNELGKPKPQYSLQCIKKNLPHNDPIWRMGLHEEFGYFREDTTTVADHEFWLRCATAGSKFAKMDDIIGIYYRNPEGISTREENKHKISQEMEEIIFPITDKIIQGNYVHDWTN